MSKLIQNSNTSPASHSRRRMIAMAVSTSLAAAGSLGGLGSTLAQEPALTIAHKRDLLASVMPIASRTIRLKPISVDFPRTVVTAIASDPRGQILAVSGDDNAIRIVDMSTMNVMHTLEMHRDLIRTLAFSPDGRKLVSAGNDGQLIVWSRDHGFKVQQEMQGSPALACVTFSPDGQQMAAVGFDNTVYMIGQSGRDQPVFNCDCTDLRTVSYRDDGKILAVAGRTGDLHLFDPKTGEVIYEANLHRGRIHDIEFWRGANRLVSVGANGHAVIFDTQTMKLVNRIRVSTGKLFAVSILDRDHIAVAGSDNIIRVVDINEGETIRRLEGHQGSIPTLAFNDGKLYSGGFDATLRRWSVEQVTGKPQRIAEGEHKIDR